MKLNCHVGRTFSTVNELPAPTRGVSDLDPARGVLLGVVVSLVIGAAVLYWLIG